MRQYTIEPNPEYGVRLDASPLLTTCQQPGCQFRVTDRTQKSALLGIEIHPCPFYVLKVKVGWMAYGPSLLQQLWDEADKQYAEFRRLNLETPGDGLGIKQQKGLLRGLAFALSLFMQPHLRTVADVSKEVHKRWEMKQADEEYETPGLGSRIYEPPPGDNKYDKRTLNEKLLGIGTLSANQVAQIKQFKDAFSVRDLSTTYGVPVSVIESIIGG